MLKDVETDLSGRLQWPVMSAWRLYLWQLISVCTKILIWVWLNFQAQNVSIQNLSLKKPPQNVWVARRAVMVASLHSTLVGLLCMLFLDEQFYTYVGQG